MSGGVQPEEQINRTVDGAVLSVLLTGLQPDTPYTVTVAAVTGLGVGAQSPPINLLSELLRSSHSLSHIWWEVQGQRPTDSL